MKQVYNKATFLTFMINEDLFAVNVKYVLEVLSQQDVTSVPVSPDFISGIIDYRGEVLPIISMYKKLKMEQHKLDDLVFIVVEVPLEFKTIKVGMTVDNVKNVVEIDEKKYIDLPDLESNFDKEFFKLGVLDNENQIPVFDLEKILSTYRIDLKKKPEDIKKDEDKKKSKSEKKSSASKKNKKSKSSKGISDRDEFFRDES